MQHTDNYPYPDFARAQASFGPALEIVTGRAPTDMTVACKVKTLHTVVSFATGMALPHDHTPEMFASPELEALATWANENQPVEMRGINWKGLIAKLLPLILTLLAETP